MWSLTVGCGFVLTRGPARFVLPAVVIAMLTLNVPARAEETMDRPAADMLAFLPSVLEMTGDPPAESNLDVMCSVQLAPGQGYASVLSVQPDRALLIAYSPHKLERPWSTMTLRGIFTKTGEPQPTDEGTMDWAYVFDRNRDGRIDFLSYLVGPIWIVPATELAGEELPSVKGGVQIDLFEEYRGNLRMGFWHLADDDYDGNHDGVVARTIDDASGWADGWIILRDNNFDLQYDGCAWAKSDFNTSTAPCIETGDGYQVPGKSFAGLKRLPPPKDFQLSTLNRVAEVCQLNADRLYSRPLRPGWPREDSAAGKDLSAKPAIEESCYVELDYETCSSMARAGDARAQERLAYMYYSGTGIDEDRVQAAAWYRESAEQGYAPAQFLFGFLHVQGTAVPQDEAAAADWYRKAALQGHVEAQFRLGISYSIGRGVPEDHVQAYAWLVVASALGSTDARDVLERLKSFMNRNEVKKGKQRALEILDEIEHRRS